MPRYHYTAIEAATGRERSGVIEATGAEEATSALKGRGLAPMALAVAGVETLPLTKTAPRNGGARAVTMAAPRRGTAAGRGPKARRRRDIVIGRVLSRKGLALFTRQLATLVKSGMPLLRALEVLARQERNRFAREMMEGLADAIRSGGNLSDGLQQHPRIFDRLYINMVKAGEAGGVLDTVLERLALFLEKAERVRGKIKAAMTYPLIIVLVATGIMSALLVFVVPKFEAIFAGLLKGQSMPPLTVAVLGVSRFVQQHVWVTAGLLAGVYVLLQAAKRTPMGTRAFDRLRLRMPLLGPLFLKAAIARFTRTFGTLLASGVPILQALTITRDTSGNVIVADAIGIVHDRVKEGDNVARPLEATGVFPGMVTSMIEVGEETGALPEMLTKIADIYDEEVDNAVQSLTSVLEPIMIVIMAVVVGIMVIALMLPIMRIVQTLG